jgi:glycosyltransferase involved in cell wall biosynthesis
MKLLFLTHPYPNYVPDLLLHGLRKLLGPAVVDFPRKDCLYEGVLGLGVCPDDQRCSGWFPTDNGQVDRSDVWAKAERGYFDLVVCDLRARPFLAEHLKRWPQRTVIIDGEDYPQKILPGPYIVCRRETDGSEYSIPLPMALPEEVFNWIARYDDVTKAYTIGFLGSTHDGARKQVVDTLARCYPQSLFQATAIPSSDAPTPKGRMGRDEYYRRLQQCRVVLTLAGAGYDTFRFWENAACNAVHAAAHMPLFIPDDFRDHHSILRFTTIDELRRRIDKLLADENRAKELVCHGRLQLISKHLTQHRAEYFLSRVKRAFRLESRGPAEAGISPGNSLRTALYPSTPMGHGVVKGNSAVLEGSPAIADRAAPAALHLGLVQGDGYGWGVCSRYLIQELSKIRPAQVLGSADGSAENSALKGALFQALTNVDFDAMFPKARAEHNFGYTFFENELTDRSKENAKRYDFVLGGSTWCLERMREKGIDNCAVLIQGIDPTLFSPIDDPVDPERFVIFSGGKFELRKGQDLVLRAVKIMQDKYPDVWLVNCWYNLWPASTRLMSYSPHIRFEHREGESWTQTMQRTYETNGLDGRRIVTCELMPQGLQRDLFARSDIGLFPNRCEGGTNLVLMEYMACAKPVIVSNTSGHKDIVHAGNALLLNALSPFNLVDAKGTLVGRWQEPSLDEVVAGLEFAYHHRTELKRYGRQAGIDLKQFTWAHSARRLLQVIQGQL